MMTKDQYIESLRKMNLKVYLMGERIENPVDHPMIRPSMNSVAMTYELAEKEEYKDLMTATSNLTGKTANVASMMRSTSANADKLADESSLLPTLCGYGCFQRHLFHDF